MKPGNLLIAEEMDTTKLADFGIAKAAEQTRITQVGSVLGTAAYLSPEQARGEEAGPASDIYSLGVCAYQFLTGRLPHEYASLTELALKQQQDAVAPITELPPRGAAGARRGRAAVASSASPRPATRSALADGRGASRPGARGEATDGHPAAWRSTDTDATRAMRGERHRGHAGAPRAPVPRSRPRARSTRRRRRARRAQREERARRPPAAARRRNSAPSWRCWRIIAAHRRRGRWCCCRRRAGTASSRSSAGDVQQQIDGLRDFIDEHSR